MTLPVAKVDIYEPSFVKNIFDRCSKKYIAFSYFCSMGFTERWRNQCAVALNLDRNITQSGLDLMAGTGEAWPHLLKHYPKIETITAVDISTGMHELAMERLHKIRLGQILFIEDDVFDSGLEENSADFIICTFGLKTFNNDQHRRFAKLVAKVLKPGGRLSMIEASDPRGWFFRPLYLFHLQRVLPLIERIYLKGAQDFAMIGQYNANFGNAKAFAEMLKDNGLDVEFKKYFYGCATGVVGSKPK